MMKTNNKLLLDVKPNFQFFNVLIVVFIGIGFITFSIKILNNCLENGFEFIYLVFIGLFLFFYYPILFTFYSLKNILVYDNCIIYYRTFFPIRKKIKFENLKGKIIINQNNIKGMHKSIYLVDRNNYTFFYLQGDYYDEIEEIYKLIKAPEVKDYNHTILKNMKLHFTGKIKIQFEKEHLDKVQNVEKKINKLAMIILYLGFIAFIITMIIKIISVLSCVSSRHF